MRRYNKKSYREDGWFEFFSVIGVIYTALMLLLYFGNRVEFWHWFAYSIVFIISITILSIVFLVLKKKLTQKHLDKIILKIRSENQEDYINNFISRFGLEDGKNTGWTFRKHNFDWDRINDLKDILKEKHIVSNEKDTFRILRYYIQNREAQVTEQSISKEPQKFINLSRNGSDFEKLIYRLFEAMGYNVEHIGRSGDQGGDLIANKNGERILVQAKNYIDWSTGNSAIQQVVGAMKFYDCNKTMVFTTSYFTPEAISLAKANNTELVSKEQLQEMLIKNLNENWI